MNHLRGRVRICGRGTPQPTVVMEVVNTRTGVVVASDNAALHTIYGPGTGLPTMVQECATATTGARIAWMYDLRRKGLK